MNSDQHSVSVWIRHLSLRLIKLEFASKLVTTKKKPTTNYLIGYFVCIQLDPMHIANERWRPLDKHLNRLSISRLFECEIIKWLIF